jgi:uncharacterized protein
MHPEPRIVRRIDAMPTPIASPCTKVCTIDSASRLCRGCGRSLDEIARWMSLSERERADITAALPRRLAASGLRPDKRSA